jgi:hypothetical protein
MVRKTRLVCAYVLTLVLGLLIGGIVTYYYIFNTFLSSYQGKSFWTRVYVLNRLVDELGLSTEQEEKARAVLDELRLELRAIRKKYHPEKEETIKRAIDRGRAFLSPEQQSKLEALFRAWQERKRETSGDGDNPKE